MILKNTFTFTFTGTLSRGFGLRSFRPKLTNLNILRIGKSVFVSVFVFVEWAFTVNLRPKKTPQAEISSVISGRKLLRPKPLESVPPQFFLPLPLPPPLQIKLGGPIAVNCSGIKNYYYLKDCGERDRCVQISNKRLLLFKRLWRERLKHASREIKDLNRN